MRLIFVQGLLECSSLDDIFWRYFESFFHSNPGLRVSVYLNLTHALNHSATTAGLYLQ